MQQGWIFIQYSLATSMTKWVRNFAVPLIQCPVMLIISFGVTSTNLQSQWPALKVQSLFFQNKSHSGHIVRHFTLLHFTVTSETIKNSEPKKVQHLLKQFPAWEFSTTLQKTTPGCINHLMNLFDAWKNWSEIDVAFIDHSCSSKHVPTIISP